MWTRLVSLSKNGGKCPVSGFESNGHYFARRPVFRMVSGLIEPRFLVYNDISKGIDLVECRLRQHFGVYVLFCTGKRQYPLAEHGTAKREMDRRP